MENESRRINGRKGFLRHMTGLYGREREDKVEEEDEAVNNKRS